MIRRLRAAGRGPVRTAAYALITVAGLARRLWPRSQAGPISDPPGRILVIRLDLLGDVVFSMSAVTALRETYPRSRITMLTLPYTAPLAKMYPSVDTVVSVDTNRIRTVRGLFSPATWREYLRVYRYLRRQKFDLCMSVSGRMASLCAFLSGARKTIGYAEDSYPFMLTDPLPGGRYSARTHEVDYVTGLARAAGVSQPHSLALPLPIAAEAAARAMLEAHGVSQGERFIAIHAGAANGSAKRWPSRYWSEFAYEVEARTGVRSVLVGARADQPIAREVLRLAPASTISLVGRTSVEELAAVLGQAAAVATGDSGPLHLAVALARPTVAIYGPTDPEIYGPYRPSAPTIVLRRDLPCSPCYTATRIADCPLGDPICMRLVSVHEVVERAVELLESPRPEALSRRGMANGAPYRGRGTG